PLGERVATLGGVLCRVRRESDGQEYLARSCAEDFPAEDEIRRFDAELEAARLPLSGCLLPPVQRIDGHKNSWLLYEPPLGAPLSLDGPCSPSAFWSLAFPMISALRECHLAGRVHGRLEPGCVWWHAETRRVTLIGALPSTSRYLATALSSTIYTAP